MSDSSERTIDKPVIFASATSPECRICMSSGLASTDPGKAVFMQTGIGIVDAAQLTARIANTGASGLISIGTAGGLKPELQPGSLLLPAGIHHTNDRRFETDPQWHARVHGALADAAPVHTGDLVCVNNIVRRPDEKASLHRETQAIAVDMESGGLAEIAARAGLPFLTLRVVMDAARDEIPESATVSVDQAGDTQKWVLLSYLAGHMSDIPGLLRTLLRFRNSSICLRSACRVAHKELLCPR